MKKITSFTHFTTGEGSRVAYTYSEIDDTGNLVSQNNKGNVIVMNIEILNCINQIEQFLHSKLGE